MTERHKGAERGDRIINLKRDLGMRKRVLDGIRQRKPFGGMTEEDVQAEIDGIKQQLRELGVEPDEEQT